MGVNKIGSSNIVLQQNSDTVTFEEVLIKQNYINDGYVFPLAEMTILVGIDDIQREIEMKFGDIKVYDYSSKTLLYQTWVLEDIMMEVVKEKDELFISAYCKSMDISSNLFKILNKYRQPSSDIYVSIYSYYLEEGHLQNGYKQYEYREYKNISNEYYPYLDTDIMFKQFLSNKENILIISGKPGVGKTSLSSQLMKFALDNSDFIPYSKEEDEYYLKVAYVKSIDVLSQDNFWVTLASQDFDLVVFDDLDFFLTSRSEEVQTGDDISKNRFLSNFLSFTDGIEQNRTKFIITTNQSYSNIDSALLRKGRLFDILELRKLKNSEAKAIWLNNNLDIKDFNFDGDVLQAELGSLITKSKNTKLTTQSYLLEQNISKSNKKPKKLGF